MLPVSHLLRATPCIRSTTTWNIIRTSTSSKGLRLLDLKTRMLLPRNAEATRILRPFLPNRRTSTASHFRRLPAARIHRNARIRPTDWLVLVRTKTNGNAHSLQVLDTRPTLAGHRPTGNNHLTRTRKHSANNSQQPTLAIRTAAVAAANKSWCHCHTLHHT